MKTFNQFIKEASYGTSKPPRKGTLAWEIAQAKKKQDADPEHQKFVASLGNDNHHYGTAKVIHTESQDRSNYDGPGKGELMSRLSTDQHLACMNYHADQNKKLQSGKHKYSSVYTKPEVQQHMQKHARMYHAHQDAIEALGDQGNVHKD